MSFFPNARTFCPVVLLFGVSLFLRREIEYTIYDVLVPSSLLCFFLLTPAHLRTCQYPSNAGSQSGGFSAAPQLWREMACHRRSLPTPTTPDPTTHPLPVRFHFPLLFKFPAPPMLVFDQRIFRLFSLSIGCFSIARLPLHLRAFPLPLSRSSWDQLDI